MAMHLRSRLVNAYHNGVRDFFRALGTKFANKTFAFGCFIAGLLIFTIFTIGIYRAEKATSINDLWIVEGTRLETEREQFDTIFGGLARSEILQVLDTENGITNAVALKAIVDGLAPMTKEDESATHGPLFANPHQLTMNITAADGSTLTMTEKDICSTALVPPAWENVPAAESAVLPDGAGGTFTVPVVFDLTGSLPVPIKGHISYGFQQLSVCLNTVSPADFPTSLPTGWGIDRFPCTRITILDCFQDGQFDYPAALTILQPTAAAIMGAYLNPASTALVTGCVDTVVNGLDAMLTPIYGAAVAPLLAEYKIALTGTIPSFGAIGYWWRPGAGAASTSSVAMSPANIFTHVDRAITNLLNNDIGLAQCVGASDQTGAVPPLSCCLGFSGAKYPTELYLGLIETDAEGARTKIGGSQSTINNENEGNPDFAGRWDAFVGGATTEEERQDIMDEWELKMVEVWQAHDATVTGADNTIVLNYAVSRSNSDIVKDGAKIEGAAIASGYIIMVLFIALVFGRFGSKVKMIQSHVLLGLGGMFTIALSTFCSFGLTSWFEVELSPVNINIVPFLSLGLGVDDMFVLGHTMIRLENKGSLEARLSHTWEMAGPSVLLTSLSNFLAFIITAVTPLPVIRSFSYQMSSAVLLNFFFLVLIFGPMLAWDLRRQMAGRMDITCQKVTEASAEDTRLAAEAEDLAADAVAEDTSILTVFARKYYAPALRNPIVKVFVLLAFGAAFGLLLWNAVENTNEGIRPSDIALESSYQGRFLNIQEVDFPAYSAFIVSQPPDMALAQQDLLDVQKAMQDVPGVAQSLQISSISWLNSLIANSLSTSLTAEGTIKPELFTTEFIRWMQTGGSTSALDIACRDNTTLVRFPCVDAPARGASNFEVYAARVSMITRNQVETPFILETLRSQRQVTDLWNDLHPTVSNNYAYGYTAIYWEQYFHITANLYEIAGVSLLGVFIGILLLQANLILSLITVVTVLMIDVEIYGMVDVIGANLNGFSLGNLVMSIGLSVEFCAHIARAFHVAHGDSLDDRMTLALGEMFAPVSYGALSSFLPIIPIAFTEFPFFRTYYFNMFAVMILIAYLNGVVLLPVLLSIFGPESLNTNPPAASAAPVKDSDQQHGVIAVSPSAVAV